MASSRKKNPSSRYSRMEEPWLDERDTTDSRDSQGDPRDEGYGVRDSYSRQASYGRPDGYYDSYRPSRDLGDTRVYSSSRVRSAYRADERREDRYREENYRQENYRDDDYREEKPSKAAYDAWDDPEYDDRYEDTPAPGRSRAAGRTRRRTDTEASSGKTGSKALSSSFMLRTA